MNKRGQISIEYLIVVGFIIFIVIGLLGGAFIYSASIQDRIKSNQLLNFAKKLIAASEQVFFLGEPSQVTINAYLPRGVEKIEIEDKSSIVFTIGTSSGTSVIAYESSVPITTDTEFSLNEGLKRFTIKAVEDEIIISEG